MRRILRAIDDRRKETPGRAYAGTEDNYGNEFGIQSLPPLSPLKWNKLWTWDHDISFIGFPVHTMSFQSDMPFNEALIAHYQLFNARYVVRELTTQFQAFGDVFSWRGRNYS